MIIKNGMITNCTVTLEDIAVANDIYGPNIKSVIEKTTRATSGELITLPTPVPPEILARHPNVVVSADTMYVNDVAFLATVSKPVDYVTAQALTSESTSNLKKSTDRVLSLYKSRGFDVTRIDADGQFECLEEHCGALLNICAHEEHVPTIERKLRVLKERCRADLSGVSFKKIPKLLVIYLACLCRA